MSRPMPDGVSPTEGAETTATIRHYRCEHCGNVNEIRHVGLVPSSFYNVVRDYVQKAAGNEFVLLPVATLNAMAEERAHAVQNAMQLDLLRRSELERAELKQRIRELEACA